MRDGEMELPRMIKVRQVLPGDLVEDVPAEVGRQLAAVGVRSRIRPGSRVAITVGSRGIAEIATVLRAVVDELKALGAHPFLVPAMGSHGGATAEGQLEVVHGYGITEESVGAPTVSSMETVQVGVTPNGAPVHMDRNAYCADHTVVVARVKPHTSFRAPIESGLCKMMAVGLGKAVGATTMHNHGVAETMPLAAQVMLERANIAFAVAVVENANHRLCRIRAVSPEGVHETDRELLALAKRLLPRIPFDPLDVLIVDLMGKNISGAGMDYNVIGMWRRIGGEQKPFYRYIVVLDLTPETEGNANGVGSADFTTRRLVSKINYAATYANSLTAGRPQNAKIPITLESDREAIETACRLAARVRGDGAPLRVARIRSTLHLDEMFASERLLPEIQSDPDLRIVEDARALAFDASGRLL